MARWPLSVFGLPRVTLLVITVGVFTVTVTVDGSLPVAPAYVNVTSVGLRGDTVVLTRRKMFSSEPVEFGWGDKLAPRLGASYDVRGDGRFKLYGSWGRYFDWTKYEVSRGAFGPTTAGRMDAYVDQFQEAGGSYVMLAKGNRSKAVTDACREHGGFYLGSIGGPAARLARDNITQVEVLEYPELGMEAVWKIEVEGFPAFMRASSIACFCAASSFDLSPAAPCIFF